MMMGMGGAASMLFGMAVWLVGWLLVLGVAAALVWWAASQWSGRRPDSALVLLRERYARGEITREEFEERRRHLAA